MKYIKSRKRFENSTGSLTFDPETKEAYSYKHWCFCRKYGKLVVFNSYRYSVSTSKHQSTVRSKLGEIDLWVDFRDSLPYSFESLIDKQVETLNKNIQDLQAAIDKKGSKKKTNDNRLGYIQHKKEQIKRLKAMQAGLKFDTTLDNLIEGRTDANISSNPRYLSFTRPYGAHRAYVNFT